MKRTFAVAAAAAFAIAAVVTAPTAAAGPDQDFLSFIAGEGIQWPAGKDQQVIDTGHAVCQDWDSGATLASEASELQNATDWTDSQVGAFIGAATGAFCPKYKSKLS